MSEASSSADVGEGVLVAETGLGRLQVAVRTSCAAFLADEPRAVGGLGSGPTPYELLSAALGACTSMTLRLYAERKGLPLERVHVSVVHRRASLDSRDIFERTIRVDGPLDDDQRARLLMMAERCPVHRTLERGADVRTTISPVAPDVDPTVAVATEHMRDMTEASEA